MSEREQQEALLELLNTTPIGSGGPQDLLADPQAATKWQRAHGGTGSAGEGRLLLEARDTLQAVVRGNQPASTLAPLLEGVTPRPQVSFEGIGWALDTPEERQLSVRVLMTWSSLQETMPGRLRSCDNPDCQRFLLDRSKPNRARWCSMATCGNRIKARRHYERTRATTCR